LHSVARIVIAVYEEILANKESNYFLEN
jgi:hypothetical protein